MDLNHRPLGYEFNTWFWMDSAIAKNQSDTVSMCWIISIVSGSPVSNLLALFGLQPTRPDPKIAVRALAVSNAGNAKFPRLPVYGAPAATPPALGLRPHEALWAPLRGRLFLPRES